MDKKTLENLSENLQIWFDEEVEIENADGSKIKISKLRRITILYIKNRGDLKVNGWGIIEPADANNPYGVYGLSQGEALELIAFSNAIWGYALALGMHDNDDWFDNNLWSKMKKIHKEDLAKIKEEIHK